jgi:hypothetical protein
VDRKTRDSTVWTTPIPSTRLDGSALYVPQTVFERDRQRRLCASQKVQMFFWVLGRPSQTLTLSCLLDRESENLIWPMDPRGMQSAKLSWFRTWTDWLQESINQWTDEYHVWRSPTSSSVRPTDVRNWRHFRSSNIHVITECFFQWHLQSRPLHFHF